MRKVLLCVSLLMMGQAAFAQAQASPSEAKESITGTWTGEWSSYRGSGRLEFQIDSFDGERIIGRVNSEAQACTLGWTALSGNVITGEVHGTYTIGPPCNRVEVIFPFPKGNVIEGKWSSEARGRGGFRLTRQSAQ